MGQSSKHLGSRVWASAKDRFTPCIRICWRAGSRGFLRRRRRVSFLRRPICGWSARLLCRRACGCRHLCWMRCCATPTITTLFSSSTALSLLISFRYIVVSVGLLLVRVVPLFGQHRIPQLRDCLFSTSIAPPPLLFQSGLVIVRLR